MSTVCSKYEYLRYILMLREEVDQLRSVCGEWEDLLCWIKGQLSSTRTPLFRSMAATMEIKPQHQPCLHLDTTINKMCARSLCSCKRDTFIFQMADKSMHTKYIYYRMYPGESSTSRKRVRRFSDVSNLGWI